MPEFAQASWFWLLLAIPLVIWFRHRARIAEPRFKRLAGIVLRCAALVLLIIALAGPLEESYSTSTDVIFVFDVSRSVDEDAARDAIAFVNHAFESRDAKSRVGLVVFGADAAVEKLLSHSAEKIGNISVDITRGGTDIGRALEVAVGAFEAEGQRRIVLLSDGQENLGRARSTAAVARSVGISVDTIVLEGKNNRDEILIHKVVAPAFAREREPFDIAMTISSQSVARAHLVITRNGSPFDEVMLTLQPGDNSYSFADQAATPGLYEYEAIINNDQDGVQENNRYQAFVQVRGAPRILHAVGDPERGETVTAALRAQGLAVDETTGSGLPANMHELVEYDLVILNNVSGLDMSLAKMQLIEDYVRDAGGGLLKLGGDNSFGAGGYHGTPVERALPVTMDIKTEVEIPSLAVTILIDKSGSMSTQEKLAIAKDAAFSAIQVLKPLDTVGVLAFADKPEWSVPPREVGDRRVIVERLRLVDSGGSTDLFAALREALRVTAQQDARVKHLILLSDGLSDTEEDTRALVDRIAQAGITVSAVAFGDDADQTLMENIAAWGGGRYYYTKDPGNVPRIFTSETLVIARNLFVEEDVRPQLVYPGEMLKGFDPAGYPPLSGYQRIFPKPAAQVLLSATEDDPLLVSWRYGLGKSTAFSSDLASDWGRQWVNWSEFGRFVAQAARWTMRRRGNERLLPQFRWSGQQAEVIVDALDRDDRFVNGLTLTGSIIDPNRTTSDLTLEQISPGRYRGEFGVPHAGRYYVNLSGSAGDLQVGPATFGLAVPYSTEYLDLGVNRELLADIANEAGGRLLPLSSTSIPLVMASQTEAPSHRGRVWWPALLAALVLLMLEIAIRKLVLPESWQLRLQGWRNRPGDTVDAQPGYDQLVADIASAREAHIESLRKETRYHPDDPAARARLYITGAGKTPPS